MKYVAYAADSARTQLAGAEAEIECRRSAEEFPPGTGIGLECPS